MEKSQIIQTWFNIDGWVQYRNGIVIQTNFNIIMTK